ncbi:Replication factor C subunit 5 [Trachymyrmex cornetzi]|uniref:Replication factor C subunit 5 n=1 Tax=Trachymyrmex cornetzi TaxID=471704 RepID=A0A151IYE4_9HYME|nr:Replication factor C subunit 5 [Trachymyrmex cornetzi]
MTSSDEQVNLPWVEKYRPKSLDELISHETIIKTINKFIDENQLPHLLLYGPPGTGKTSTILACARKLYTPAQFNSVVVLELNASDDRGIGIVRDQILSFASRGAMYKSAFKLIILDEADATTNDAQNALRRKIQELKLNKGLALQDILTEVHSYVMKLDLPNQLFMDLLCKMAEIEKRLASGCRDDIQLNSLISAFYSVRDYIDTFCYVD